MVSFLFVWFLFSTNGLIVSLLVGIQGQIIRQPISEQYEITHRKVEARSRAVSTKRTILSPFTKEYRVRAAISGIRLFLEGSFPSPRPVETRVQALAVTITQFKVLKGIKHNSRLSSLKLNSRLRSFRCHLFLLTVNALKSHLTKKESSDLLFSP
ncbi:hypothetical protein Peur_049492 [Populus x canadensis]